MFDGRQPAAIKCKRSSSLRSRSVRAGVGRRWRVCSQSSVGSDSDLELELVQRCERFDCFVGCLVECFVGCLVECFVRCLVECFAGCLVECFVRCLVECFVRCLVGCFARCLVGCFARCRPVGYRENVTMLHMSIFLSGFVGRSFLCAPGRGARRSRGPRQPWRVLPPPASMQCGAHRTLCS